MKQIAQVIIKRYITFLPLIVFMASYNIWSSWKTAFIVGGAVSCFYLSVVFYKRITQDSFMTGINCFLLGGASMYLFNIGWLGWIYEYFGYTTILLWIFIVGLCTTILSSEGFIGIEHANKKLVRLFSVYLLLGTLLAIGGSLYFAEQMARFGFVPFVFLFLLRSVLVTQAQKCSS